MSMTTIKATCPMCGDVDLSAPQVTVTLAVELGWATYGFNCPKCHDAVEKTADDATVDLLRSAGVRVEKLHIPAEALEFRLGPQFTYDDILDAVLMLEGTEDIIGELDRVARL
jgi:endogenous inhibitor of DNA gyrase (YacG/DUF329 family)